MPAASYVEPGARGTRSAPPQEAGGERHLLPLPLFLIVITPRWACALSCMKSSGRTICSVSTALGNGRPKTTPVPFSVPPARCYQIVTP
jgi:hypothetical protein